MIYWDNYHVEGIDAYGNEQELYTTNNLREAKQAAREYVKEGYETVKVWDRRKREYIYFCGDKSLFGNA